MKNVLERRIIEYDVAEMRSHMGRGGLTFDAARLTTHVQSTACVTSPFPSQLLDPEMTHSVLI